MSHRCRTGCTKRSYDRFESLDGIRTFDEGYLCSVRISDYAGHEGEIDWTRTKASKEVVDKQKKVYFCKSKE